MIRAGLLTVIIITKCLPHKALINAKGKKGGTEHGSPDTRKGSEKGGNLPKFTRWQAVLSTQVCLTHAVFYPRSPGYEG